LSLYLRVLEEIVPDAEGTISSRALADRAGTTAAQVRKDLSFFGSFGKRGLGYAVEPLTRELRGILGLSRTWRVALVGAGRIGSALFAYPHFKDRGFEFVAVFDADPEKIGDRWGTLVIQSPEALVDALRAERVEIAIVAVPAESAQEVASRVVEAGVRGILNFTPAPLHVPDGVHVNDVNMSVELEAMTFARG
jgi:redox-sensing transcriptional repressor